MSDSIRDRRTQYETSGLDVGDLDPDPLAQWQRWHDDALDAGVAEPNAMVLSTAGLDGVPDARVVLVRGVGDEGLAFFTNYRSAKSRQLDEHPAAAATFGWLDLHRQVRVRGRVDRLPDDESDAYFASRPRESQLGAWSSPQSEVIVDRHALEARVAATEERFAAHAEVPRPPHWGGWRLVPAVWEFWQGRPNRLHDRLRYRAAVEGSPGAAWTIERLAP